MCAETAMCFGGLMRKTPADIQLQIVHIKGSSPAIARNMLAKGALGAGADYLFWFDSDMVFPIDSIERLLSHKKQGIVGADYRKRGAPYPTVGKAALPYPTDNRELWPYDYLPHGLLLVHKSVYEKVAFPWYQETYIGDDMTSDTGWQTEDTYFCREARKAGVEVLCDVPLTNLVSHIGSMPVPWDIRSAQLPPADKMYGDVQ
jgi:hypothetical protein